MVKNKNPAGKTRPVFYMKNHKDTIIKEYYFEDSISNFLPSSDT